MAQQSIFSHLSSRPHEHIGETHLFTQKRMVMLILYIATGAFIVGGGLIMVSNVFAPRSRSRYY